MLERPSPAGALLLLLPLAFVLVGGGGILLVWRRPRPEAGAISTASAADGRRLAPLVAGALLVAVGLPLAYFFSVRPVGRVLSARSWTRVPCTVVWSRVSVSSDGDGTTYGVDILYRYQVGGLTLHSDRHDFVGGSSSGRAGKEAVVGRYPAGSRASCWVDPEDPVEAVLDRRFPPLLLLGLIPLLLVAIGGALLAHAARRRGPVVDLAARAATPPRAPHPGRPSELRPTVGPAGKLAGALVACLFWNGIVGVILWQVVSGWRAGQQPWGLSLFLLPFVAVGLGLVAAVGYFALALTNPRPRLALLSGETRIGSSCTLEWRLEGAARRISRLRIALEGREEATYRRGTDTQTDRQVFHRVELLDSPFAPEVERGQLTAAIPDDTMHSFAAPHNRVVWAVTVRGEIPRWPDVSEELPLEVLPMAAEAVRR